MEKRYIKSFDGETLCVRQWFADSPKANVLLLHGISEHGGRYARFAEYLNGLGYNVWADDHRAHGETASKIGVTDSRDVFSDIVSDQIFWAEELKKEGLPLVVFGHSFGSFVAQKLFTVLPASAYILCGSSYMKTAEVAAGKFVAACTCAFCGGEKEARLIEKMSFGNYGKPFGGGSFWLSKNADNVAEYESDEMCGKPFCAAFYRSMFRNIYRLYGKDMGAANRNTPLFIIGGADDPVGKSGKGITRLYDEYKKRGFSAKLKLYPGLRHEILNEKEYFEVYADIAEFIEDALS